MESTEQERTAARLCGITVEEWRRRGTVAMRANQVETAGGVVMCQARDGRMVSMSDSDGGDANGSTAEEMAEQAQQHLQRFRDNPKAKNSHEHIARASAMCSAALSRCARDNGESASATSMHSFRG